MSTTLFQITNGLFGLTLVNPAASGYADAWQAPAGKTAATAAIGDYAADATSFACQITKGQLTGSPSNTTESVEATFCSPAKETPNPGETSYGLEISLYQDPNVHNGLSAWLFENDVKEAFFLLGMGDGALVPPRAIGRVRVAAATIGGAARTSLKADLTLPVSRKPDILFGTTGSTRLVFGSGAASVNTPA